MEKFTKEDEKYSSLKDENKHLQKQLKDAKKEMQLF